MVVVVVFKVFVVVVSRLLLLLLFSKFLLLLLFQGCCCYCGCFEKIEKKFQKLKIQMKIHLFILKTFFILQKK